MRYAKLNLLFPKVTQESKWGNQGKCMDFVAPVTQSIFPFILPSYLATTHCWRAKDPK